MADIAAISDLMCEEGVDALVSVEPIIPIMNKGLDVTYEQKTYQTGDTVHIRIEDQPGRPVQSAQMKMDPVQQQQISTTVLQYNDGYALDGLFQLYDLGGEKLVRERVGTPRMKNMAVEAALKCYDELATCPGYVGTAGTAIKTAADFGMFQAALNEQLAMDSGLYVVMSPTSMAGVASELAAAFNPTSESSTAYMKGRVKEAMGLNFFQSSNIPNHTNGTAVGTGAAGMALSANVTSGATTISVTGGTANGTITAGSLVWFPGCFEVQPNTKKTLSRIRYWTVAETVQLSGSGVGDIVLTIPIYGPENNKLQNSSKLPTSSPTQYVGIVGEASAIYEQMLGLKKNSSAFIGLRLPDLVMQKVTETNEGGVPIKISAGSDLIGYQNLMRWDILVAAKNLQFRHQYRAFVKRIG